MNIVYCSESKTLRQLPQNYCLAVFDEGRFWPAVAIDSTINNHSMNIVLNQFYKQIQCVSSLNEIQLGQAAAEFVHKAFYVGA